MYNNSMETIPTLESERLALRGLTPADAPGLFDLYSNPEVTRFINLDRLNRPEEANEIVAQLMAQAERGEGLRWGVFEAETGQLIGTCGYHHWVKEKFRAEISYDLGPSHWGNGYMREALQAVLQYGFSGLKLHRVEALVDPLDTRSQNLLFGLGFKLEGVLHEHDFLGGKFEDDMVFALLRPQWPR